LFSSLLGKPRFTHGMKQPDWFANDALFFEQLEEGHLWALRVGWRLLAEGFPVQVTKPTRRQTIADRGDYADELDIRVGRSDPLILEVKSRALVFTEDPASYPYATAFVDTAKGWKAKWHKPVAVVLVSQRTGSMLVIPVRTTQESWGIEKHTDHVRGFHERFYTVEKRWLQSFDALIGWLRRVLAERHDL
jgi:hypothetical protein